MNTAQIINLLLDLPKPTQPCFELAVVAPYFDENYNLVRTSVVASHEIACLTNIFGETAIKVELTHNALADIRYTYNDVNKFTALLLESESECYEADYPVSIRITDRNGDLKTIELDSLFDQADNPEYLAIKTILANYIFPYDAINESADSLDITALISLFPSES